MQLLFERSHTGRRCTILPACDVAVELPDASLCRAQAPHLPSLSKTKSAVTTPNLPNRHTVSTTDSIL